MPACLDDRDQGLSNETLDSCDVLIGILPLDRLAYHIHDTGGTALENVETPFAYGSSTFDSTAVGTNGQTSVPGVLGNLGTEIMACGWHSSGSRQTQLPRIEAAAAFDREHLDIDKGMAASKRGGHA